ncbi:PREDICTED: GDSL esterase/lipase At4g16230-like [Prunus mume]|uniref:GDSL esterase/lipase At4g16230-like n=1 Tax=Prunus mume TaxID=102107 RepID=A0ABM0PBV8_PRUMU|nr:PREDICTED: GDSL esterase/lipase At4g16230-like [Prunus mume]
MQYHSLKQPSKQVVLLYLSLFVCLPLSISICNFAEDGAATRGMFVFGSSLVDNGNNNFFESRAKADYLPYGIDFPNGPSGRFTNGKNVVDLLGDQLKLPSFIPPSKDPSTKGSKIVHGVNHASGSSGILDDTGSVAGNVINLSQQIRDFEEETLPELEAELGCKSSESLPSYLFVVGVGGNDYMFNYFARRSYLQFGLEAFTRRLIASLAQKLQKLYSLGGRKFVVMSINPLGYSPVLHRPNFIGSPQALSQAAQMYNVQLKIQLDALKRSMPDFNFALVNTYNIMTNIIQNPASTGFEDTSNPCCKVTSQIQGGNGVLCDRGGKTSSNRTRNVFFDGLHPTEALNFQIASKAYASTLEFDVYPINVRQLAQL